MKKISLVFSFLGLCCNASYAIPSQGNWYVGFETGFVFSHISKYQSLPTGSGWPNDLYRSQINDAPPLVGFSGGYTWLTHQDLLPYFSTGARYSYMFPAKITGRIMQYSLPQFENYDFHYQIDRQNLLGMMKAHLKPYKRFVPFLAVGLGLSSIKANNYKESTISAGVTPRLSPDFRTHRSNNLAYSLETGVDYVLATNISLGMKYAYQDLGRLHTGTGTLGYSSEHLRAKLTNQTIAITGHYYFDKGAQAT